MKRQTLCVIAVFGFIFSTFYGCGPAKVEKLVTIKANETGFLVPLEGATRDAQGKFMSTEYLNENKVATKRISLPLRTKKSGRGWWNYEYIPTMAVIAVNRTPVTREWTGNKETGTAKKDQALWVESQDSIGFGVGVNVTAMVMEEDAALFLYTYAATPLENIVDENVRGFVNSILSRKFAENELEMGRRKKNEIFDEASKKTIEHFAKMGVAITNLGLAEGLVYEDKEIQTAINKKFMAEMQIQIEDQVNMSQDKINSRNVGISTAEKLAAQQFEKAAEARVKQVRLEIERMIAEARLVTANKWDGKLPASILPSDSPLLFNLQGEGENK